MGKRYRRPPLERRLEAATGADLDRIAADVLNLVRGTGESDAAFRRRTLHLALRPVTGMPSGRMFKGRPLPKTQEEYTREVMAEPVEAVEEPAKLTPKEYRASFTVPIESMEGWGEGPVAGFMKQIAEQAAAEQMAELERRFAGMQLETATGKDLDDLSGLVLGITRKPGETDEELRTRIRDGEDLDLPKKRPKRKAEKDWSW